MGNGHKKRKYETINYNHYCSSWLPLIFHIYVLWDLNLIFIFKYILKWAGCVLIKAATQWSWGPSSRLHRGLPTHPLSLGDKQNSDLVWFVWARYTYTRHSTRCFPTVRLHQFQQVLHLIPEETRWRRRRRRRRRKLNMLRRHNIWE